MAISRRCEPNAYLQSPAGSQIFNNLYLLGLNYAVEMPVTPKRSATDRSRNLGDFRR